MTSLIIIISLALWVCMLHRYMLNLKKNCNSIEKKEKRYRSLYESMNEGVALQKIVYDESGNAIDYRIIEVNSAYEKITGMKKETVTGELASTLYKNGSVEYIDIFSRVVSSGKAASFEAWFPPVGKHFGISVISPEKGMFATIFSDITDKKRVEDAVHETTKRFIVTFEHAAVGMCIEGENGQILMVNHAMCEMLGYTEENLMGKFFFDITHEEDIKEHDLNRQVLLAGKIDSAKFEKRYVHKSGKTIWALVSIAVIRESEQTSGYFIIHVQDITERKHLESQLRQAHKMEAIGTMAGGIAHDFNNILGIILGNIELTMDDIPQSHCIWANLEEIRIAGLRGKDVVHQLLGFSRKSENKKKTISLGPVIEETLKLMRASIPSNIEIIKNISDKTSYIMADATQMHQIIINLCTNAAHAMADDGGILKIEIHHTVVDPNSAELFHLIHSGPYVRLSVADSGCGIEQNIINRIFDPYFTTKDVGKGTGMGLSVVHGIVKSHDGVVSVDSLPGKGTEFNIYFPVVLHKEIKQFVDNRPLSIGTERILLVDDEPSIVKLGKRMLLSLGYDVTAVTNPGDAFEAFSSNPDDFDLLISDMAMSNMTGIQLARGVKYLKPDIPVIICTGYSDQINAETIEKAGIEGFILKPIVKKELANLIRTILDKNKMP
ncbi:PAS domain S-box protein [Desulfobacterales bacterium HSG16]|nr:PAS domain S-box protein [Desulfobacterales bacterium HSG16]